MSQIELRDYQLEAVKSVQKEYKLKTRRQLIVLPTGTGKTIVFAAISKDFNKRTLILAHRDELIQQAVAKARLYWPEADIGIVKADLQEYDHQIVVGSVQSCMYKKRIKRLKEQGFQILIIDEAHHAVAASYQKIIKKLGFIRKTGKQLLLGFTATPERADNLGLGDTFQKIVFMRSIATMIAQGYLCPVSAHRCLTGVSLDGIRTLRGDFQVGDLATAVNIQGRNEFIVDKYQLHGEGRKAVAFCVDVQHCHDLAKAFNDRGITAKAVWGAMDLDERRRTLVELHDGTIKICTSCGVLTEGFDEPSINCILMARPTKSRGLYIQCVGRGLRTDMGKSDCLVLDFADQGHDLNSVMTLRNTMPEVIEASEREELLLKEETDKPSNVPVIEVYDGQFDILGRAAFLWVDIGDGEYSLMDDAYREIILSPVGDDKYMATLWRNDIKTDILDRPLPLDYARGVCEDYARQYLEIKYCESTSLLYSTNRLAPTDKQIKLLEKYGISADNMSKSQAAIAIRQYHAIHKKQLRQLAAVPLTDKQKFYLESQGIKTGGTSKIDAMRMISMLKKGIRPNINSYFTANHK